MLSDYNPLEGRRDFKLHCLITLLQPLSHIAETTGNEAALKTMRVQDPDGFPAEVPIYSGNAQRNGVMGRRTGIAALFDALDVKVNDDTHKTFYAGGHGGSGENDLDWETKVRKLFPYLSLLGTDVPAGVLGKKKPQMIPGRIAIGDAILVCYESIPYLQKMFAPAVPINCSEAAQLIVEAEAAYQSARVAVWQGLEPRSVEVEAKERLDELRAWLPYLQQELRTATEWMDLRTKTRRDSLKSPELKRHLLAGDPILAGTDKKKEKKEKATGQMIASSWCVQAGAQLYSYWCGKGQGVTELEEGALVDTLLHFSKQPYIGGQSSTGCGLCSMEIWYQSGEEKGKWLAIAPNGVQQLSPRAEECHQRYTEMLAVYREYLDELKAGNSMESSELKDMLLGA